VVRERRKQLSVDTVQERGTDVVRVRGEIDLRCSPELRDRLLEAAGGGRGLLVIDLSDVPYMDSSGVGTMVYVKREAERAGRQLVLLGLQPRVRSLFEIAHLDKFFRIIGDLGEVVRA
jgi:anti-sigma B factor antagonist